MNIEIAAFCVCVTDSPNHRRLWLRSAAGSNTRGGTRAAELQRPIKAFVNIAAKWDLGEAQARGLLGGIASSTFHTWRTQSRGKCLDQDILVAFLAGCLQVTLKNRLQRRAPGLTPAVVLHKLAAIQLIDAWIPTVDGRWLILPRYTQPEKICNCCSISRD